MRQVEKPNDCCSATAIQGNGKPRKAAPSLGKYLLPGILSLAVWY